MKTTDDPSRCVPTRPRPAPRDTSDSDPGDASDPDRPIPRDPGKVIDFDVDEDTSRDDPHR